MENRFLFLWILLVILLFPIWLYGSGVLKGRVIDNQTKQPLPGANVQILGTVRGGSADLDGRFIVQKIPEGAYEVRATMISYQSDTKVGVLIQHDKTTEIFFELTETAIEFDPIVVLAGKTKQRLDEANVSLSVISAKEIEQRNPTNLIEALESAPGVHFVGDQINIRGSTGFTFGAGNKVLLLLDGVPVYSSDTGEFNWDMLPPLDIEQIEVLKGAGSTLWGASALGGVVNVITKSPSLEGKVLFQFAAGKYDKPYYQEWTWTDHNRLTYNREDISYSRQIGKLGLRVSAGRFVSQGYRQLGDFTKYNLTAKFDVRFKNSIKWTGYAGYSYIDRGFFIQWKSQNDPYEVDDAYKDLYAKTNQLNLYTKLAMPISPILAINVRASLIRSLLGNQFGESENFKPAFGQGLEVQFDWIPISNHTVTAGIQYQYDAGSVVALDVLNQYTGYFIGTYLQDEWKIRKSLRLTTGLRYDRHQLIGRGKEDLFSPRIGFNWRPWEKTTLRGSVGSGFRAPTIVERFLELTIMNFKIIPNKDLKAERAWAYDIGFRQYITKDWNIDISFFDNEYWNQIEAHLDLLRGQIHFRNRPRITIRGFEMTSKMAFPAHILSLRFTPSLEISVTGMDHQDKKWEEPLPYRPKLILSVEPSIQVGPFDVQVDYRYASKIDEVKVYPINDRVAMNFINARLVYHFWYLSAQLGVNNLLQYNYAPMESNLMAPRTWTMGLKGEF